MAKTQTVETIEDMLKFINSRSILLKQALQERDTNAIKKHLEELQRQNWKLYRKVRRSNLREIKNLTQKISAELNSIGKNQIDHGKCLGFVGVIINLTKRKSAERLYTERASLYHRVFIDFFRYDKALKRFFLKNDYLSSNMNILDAGCGTGVLTRVLYEISIENKLSGILFHGFDLTQSMLDIFSQWISKNNVANIQILKANVLELNNLPRNWNDYNLIVSSAMLEHLPTNQVPNAIRNMGNLLQKNGTMLIFITKRNFIMRFLVQWWWKANIYHQEEIKKMFQEAGFRNINFRKFSFGHMRLWGHIIEAKK